MSELINFSNFEAELDNNQQRESLSAIDSIDLLHTTRN